MIKSLVNRSFGCFSGHDTHRTIDYLLSNLTCHQDDEYPGILSTSNSAPSSDLLYACKFSSTPGFEHILALANEEGKIALQNTKVVGKARPILGYQAHDNAIFDLCWVPSEPRLITASGDQSSVLWDIGATTVTPTSIFRGHTASIKAVDVCPVDPFVFASGSRDGSIMIWDTRINNASKAENVIRNAHPLSSHVEVRCSRTKRKATPSNVGNNTVNSVTAVVFQSNHTLISAGATDGNINIWDLRKNYTVYKGDPLPKYRIPYGLYSNRSGITSLCLDPSRIKLYAASMDDVIYEFNVVSYDDSPMSVYGGHEQHSFYIKTCLSGDGKYLLSGSSDDHAYIWKIGAGPRPLLKLEGHGAEVTCVAWCPNDITNLVTCADDVRHRVWRINDPTDYMEGNMKIRGRPQVVDATSAVPQSCNQVLQRLLKKKAGTQVASSCKTPCSSRKNIPLLSAERTPEASSCAKKAARSPRKMLSPRKILSPVNEENSFSHFNNRASRRLEMGAVDYSSPTRDLPNYVMDGQSPHRTPRSSSKRKRLDWLTDLGRKLTPNKVQRVK